MSEWTVRPATLADRDAAIALMDRAFGPSKIRARLWDWAFAQNPHTSDLYYLVADAGTRLAAQYAAIPVAMQYQGQPIRGLLSLFTATDPSFRRRGLFPTLAKALYEHAEPTCPIVFGFPNENSAPTFYKHLNWIDLRPFPLLRRTLRNSGHYPRGRRAATLAARVLEVADRAMKDKTVTVVPVDNFNGIADRLWDLVKPQAGVTITRDAQFLNWRFVQSPFEYLRLVAMRDGQPVGIAVLAADATDGQAKLMEFIVAPGENVQATRTLLARVIDIASQTGAFVLRFVATPRHPQWKTLVASGLLPAVPTTIQLSPIDTPVSSFGVRVNNSRVAASRVLHIDDWYLSGADLDWI